MAKQVIVIVDTEAKDEYEGPSGDWRAGYEPGIDEVASRLQDVLADVTRADRSQGWRVTRVVPLVSPAGEEADRG